jgi:GTPase SAR1 family protein
MKKVIFLIGLPASGKTTLIKHYKKHPYLNFKIYDDWSSGWYQQLKFNEYTGYPSLVDDIKKNNNIIISCIDFCNKEYLLQSEMILKLEFDNIEIEKIYWENNLEASIKNIHKRDKKRGGHWKWCDKKKTDFYYGLHYDEKPQYRWEIENAERLSKIYKVPLNYTALPIKTSK